MRNNWEDELQNVGVKKVVYIGGLLSGEKLIKLTEETIENKKGLVKLYGYELVWLDMTNHMPTTAPAVWYADRFIWPAMELASKDDIWVINSAGIQMFLFELLVRKALFRGKICQVETTNGGLPRVVAHGMNLLNRLGKTDSDDVDPNSPFMRDLRPNSWMNKAIRENLGDYKPDVQVTARFTEMFCKFNIFGWDLFGIGSMFRPFPEPAPLKYDDIEHTQILAHDEIIEAMFKKLGIEKVV